MMKRFKTAIYVLWTSIILFFLVTPYAFAAEEASGWRPIYDEVMVWVNFGIFAFIIIKFGRKPLADFIQGQKDQTERDIRKLEQEKQETIERIQKAHAGLEKTEARFEEVKSRIIEQGKKRKQEIIEEAQLHSKVMLEDAQRKTEAKINSAKQSFRSELIDAAIGLVAQKLPKQITDADNSKLTDRYIDQDLAKFKA